MEGFKCWKERILGSGGGHSDHSRSRTAYWLVVLGACCLAGCTTIKKASLVGMAAGIGATAGTVLSSGVAAPILGATTTAFVVDAVTEAIPIGATGKKAMSECAGDNFWTLLGQIVSVGGWGLILVILIPMVFSWLLPGPIRFKKKND